jgi:Uma2 family endonuclease
MSKQLETSEIGQPTIEILSLFPRQGEWTEADYFRLPETNRIIELSKGRLVMAPAPTIQHQIIIGNLYFTIKSHIMAKKLGEVVMSPVDVRLWEGNIRQPDIVFMSNEHQNRITKQYLGVPDLVIEILSESSIDTDREDKYHEYEKAGVQEYWIVDPFAQCIDIYTLEDGTYISYGKWEIGKVAKSKLLSGLEVKVDEII